MVCVGYAGMEAFDIILYVGQILARLHIPVLIIDLSDTGVMTKAIYHGMNIDSANTIVNYRSLNYIRAIPNDKDLEDFAEGVVFVDFGFRYIDIMPIKLDYMNIVVDSLPSNIERVGTLLNEMSINNTQTRLLIRNIISMDDVERVTRNITQDNTWYSINYLYLELSDYENAIKCQMSQTIGLRRISKRMKKYITHEINGILPDIKLSKIRKMVFWSGKGRKKYE